jgi:hypothetical protein
MKKVLLIVIVLAWFLPKSGSSQLQWEPKQRKNVIKFNPTPMLLWGDTKNITLAYERLIRPNQSVSLQAGYLLFPRVARDTVANLVAIHPGKKWGLNFALDYRYYPMARNKRSAPDGVYIGGFASYYGFRFKNDMDVLHTTIDQNAAIKGQLYIYNVGFELGYQFLFWKRFSLDLLLFGPSLSYYSGSLAFEGSLDKTQIENIDQELVDKILAKFPYLKTLFSGETLHFTGHRNLFSLGFRYSMCLGIAF